MNTLKVTKWLLLVAGVLVIILGISMLFTPMRNIVALALYIGITMLLSGIGEILSYFVMDKRYRSGWIIASGIVTLLFGIWLLFGHGLDALAIMLPFVFAGWVIAGGVIRGIGAFSLKSAGVKGWWLVLIFGVLSVLMGAVLMYAPFISVMMISYLIAFAFISHGVNSVSAFFSINRIGKFFKELKQ